MGNISHKLDKKMFDPRMQERTLQEALFLGGWRDIEEAIVYCSFSHKLLEALKENNYQSSFATWPR